MTKEQLNTLLEEITSFDMELAEDPTLPELGNKYLQSSISKCRHFMNRVMYYLQTVGRYEKELRREVRSIELDIDFKSNEMLANDSEVRRLPNIKDRDALIAFKLRTEHANGIEKKLVLIDVEETVKMLKMKYNDLKALNADIKLQRQMVRDEFNPFDMPGRSVRPDGIIVAGMPPAATAKFISPSDILDPNSRPEGIPEPLDGIHAAQLSEFYNRNIRSQPTPVKSTPEKLEKKEEKLAVIDYGSLLD